MEIKLKYVFKRKQEQKDMVAFLHVFPYTCIYLLSINHVNNFDLAFQGYVYKNLCSLVINRCIRANNGSYKSILNYAFIKIKLIFNYSLS